MWWRTKPQATVPADVCRYAGRDVLAVDWNLRPPQLFLFERQHVPEHLRELVALWLVLVGRQHAVAYELNESLRLIFGTPVNENHT